MFSIPSNSGSPGRGPDPPPLGRKRPQVPIASDFSDTSPSQPPSVSRFSSPPSRPIHSAGAAPRSAAESRRTLAGSAALPLTAASSTLHQSPTRLNQPLLQAGQRPVIDLLRHHQPPPQVPQVVGQYAQLQAHFVGPGNDGSSAASPSPPACLL